MQFRIWAEMIIGGIHASHDEPPSTTMFSRSGSVNVMKKSSSNAVVQVVEKLASVLTPKSSNGPAQSTVFAVITAPPQLKRHPAQKHNFSSLNLAPCIFLNYFRRRLAN